MQKTMRPSLWALWKVGAEITHSLSRSKLLAALEGEHRPLYSQPHPCCTIIPRLIQAGQCLLLLFRFAGCSGSHTQKQNPWKRNSSQKTLQRPSDEKNPKPSRYLLWRAVHEHSAGTWHRSICWGHERLGDKSGLRMASEPPRLWISLMEQVWWKQKSEKPAKSGSGPAARRVRAHCAQGVPVQRDMKTPCCHYVLLSLLSDTEMFFSLTRWKAVVNLAESANYFCNNEGCSYISRLGFSSHLFPPNSSLLPSWGFFITKAALEKAREVPEMSAVLRLSVMLPRSLQNSRKSVHLGVKHELKPPKSGLEKEKFAVGWRH